MAEERDAADRTEEPTPKRLEDARQQGQVAQSREVSNLLVLGAGTAGIALSPLVAEQVSGPLRSMFAPAALLRSGPGEIGSALLTLAEVLALCLAPTAILVLLAGVGASALQGAIVWSPEPLMPKPERLSPLAGAKRIFGPQAFVEFAKGLGKVALVGVLGGVALAHQADDILGLIERPVQAVPGRLVGAAVELLGVSVALVAVLAGLDWLWQRQQFLRRMRMTRRDIKEEVRQSEGDPAVRQRLRSLRMEKARRRMMADVPASTVVITNPTHVAVALRYDASMPAPKLVAKGTERVAARIREVAREHGVPLVENPPLARTLLAGVEVGEFVPEQHYRAVAEVIGYVMNLGASHRP